MSSEFPRFLLHRKLLSKKKKKKKNQVIELLTLSISFIRVSLFSQTPVSSLFSHFYQLLFTWKYLFSSQNFLYSVSYHNVLEPTFQSVGSKRFFSESDGGISLTSKRGPYLPSHCTKESGAVTLFGWIKFYKVLRK